MLRAHKDQTTLPFLLEWRPRKFFGARRYLFLCSGQGGQSPSARVQREPSEAARCASTEDQPRCPILLSVPFHNRTMLSLCLNQISALTTNEKMRNSCRCSFTIATTGNNPKAASAPPEE